MIGVVDLGFCALAMYILVPDEPHVGFIVVAVIFVSATLLGFASHSPGGLGVFEGLVVSLVAPFIDGELVRREPGWIIANNFWYREE